MRQRPVLRQFGLRLALAAAALQAMLPLLLAALLCASPAPADAAIADPPLCLHDGAPPPADGSKPQGCGVACPLCASLAASHAPVLAGADAIVVPPEAVSAASLRVEDWALARRLSARPYQSRAPPLA